MTKTDEQWRSERWMAYDPDSLPEQIERKVFVLYGTEDWNQGNISINDIAASGNLVLAEHVLTLSIPTQGIKELKGKMLAVLETEKSEIMAQNHVRLKTVQDKIDNLLAIEYQATEKTND